MTYFEMMYECRAHQSAHTHIFVSLSHVGISDKIQSFYTLFTLSVMRMGLSWSNTMSTVNAAINFDVHMTSEVKYYTQRPDKHPAIHARNNGAKRLCNPLQRNGSINTLPHRRNDVTFQQYQLSCDLFSVVRAAPM
jgi:hypothetical protein